MVPFKIVSDSPALHSRWPLLLKIEISSNGQNCSILSQNVPKFELYKHNDELFNRRNCWTRPWIKQRNVFGAHHALLEELRRKDPNSYKNYALHLFCVNIPPIYSINLLFLPMQQNKGMINTDHTKNRGRNQCNK